MVKFNGKGFNEGLQSREQDTLDTRPKLVQTQSALMTLFSQPFFFPEFFYNKFSPKPLHYLYRITKPTMC